MAKKLKKIDFRTDEELYNKLEFIMDVTGAKRSSWCRTAVEYRVERFEEDNNTTEEDYERFKKRRELQHKRDNREN